MRQNMYRDAILQVCTCEHRTASQIFQLLKKKYPALGQATIYRTVKQLAKEGFLTKITGLGNHAHYEVSGNNHAHLIDSKSGKIQDIELPENIIRSIKLPTGYKACRVDVKIYGSFKK